MVTAKKCCGSLGYRTRALSKRSDGNSLQAACPFFQGAVSFFQKRFKGSMVEARSQRINDSKWSMTPPLPTPPGGQHATGKEEEHSCAAVLTGLLQRLLCHFKYQTAADGPELCCTGETCKVSHLPGDL